MNQPETLLVRHADGDAHVQLQFTYSEAELDFERVFNMNRLPDEQVSTLSAKITSSVGKFLGNKANKKLKKKKKAVDGTVTPPPPAELISPPAQVLLDGTPAPGHMTCLEALVTRGDRAQLRIGRRLYSACLNPPAVLQLALPSYLMAGYPVRPTKLQLAFATAEDCQLSWQREAEGGDWREVAEGGCYTPASEEVGARLRLVCTPRSGERTGEPAVTEPGTVQAGPGPCPFQQRHAFTAELTGDNSYRVVSYNLLADLYADSDYTRTVLHPYCPPYALHIDYRRQLLVRELKGYNADVLCLQEVDRKVFDGDLVPCLGEDGLHGVYTCKGGQVTEGLVCFYRASKLSVVSSERYVLGEVVLEDPLFEDVARACQACPALQERLTRRTQALQVCVLRSTVAPHRLLVVANTHLYFHPDADHVRALQIGVCMRLLQRLLEGLRTENPEQQVALLFCGDFNSCPDFSVLRLMRTQRLPEDLPDFSSKEGEEVRGVSFHQPYHMDSACGTPPYTNHVDRFVGCLDYIFYMTDRMQVDQVVPLPSDEEVTRHTALPSVVFPSDHLALVADLTWRPS